MVIIIHVRWHRPWPTRPVEALFSDTSLFATNPSSTESGRPTELALPQAYILGPIAGSEVWPWSLRGFRRLFVLWFWVREFQRCRSRGAELRDETQSARMQTQRRRIRRPLLRHAESRLRRLQDTIRYKNVCYVRRRSVFFFSSSISSTSISFLLSKVFFLVLVHFLFTVFIVGSVIQTLVRFTLLISLQHSMTNSSSLLL